MLVVSHAGRAAWYIVHVLLEDNELVRHQTSRTLQVTAAESELRSTLR